jgi:aspartate beta-hydroxylase
VELSSTLPAARLHLAEVLERLGEHHAALVQYTRVMGDQQNAGKWVNAATTPPALVELVAHAAQVVRAGRRNLLSRLLEPLAQEFGAAELSRVARMLRIYLGDEAADYPDPRQRPTFLFFPGLPATPYLDRDALPWVESLEAHTAGILRELEALLPAGQGSERVFGSDELEAENLRGNRGAPSWTGFYFYRHGERREENCSACPLTIGALDELPLSRVREHGPEVLFSVFTPGTHLLPHRGVTNTRVVGHLPLIVPPECLLRVGGVGHAWQEGRVVVFDDTYEHEAWNLSDRIRVVLIFDLWHPQLTETERAAVSRVVAGIGDFRAEVESG